MRKGKPHIASIDEVTISRDGEDAVIEYNDKDISTVHLHIGRRIQKLTDEDILEIMEKTGKKCTRWRRESVPPGNKM